MDSGWNFRHAYDEARQLKETQDRYCDKAEAGLWTGIGSFPEDLKWEALADVLRGKVKVRVCFSNRVNLSLSSLIDVSAIDSLLRGAPYICAFATHVLMCTNSLWLGR